MLNSTVLLLIIATQSSEPQAALERVRDRYRGFSSFSMTIEHKDSSGLFPGQYKQKLVWSKGGKFELTTTSSAGAGKNSNAAGRKAPNYYADGKSVVSVHPDGKRSSSGLVPDQNTSPSWEVSGGLILSWLQDTPAGKFIFNPPGDLKTSWAWGTEKSFRGLAAKEIVLTWGGTDHKASLYISPDENQLLGMVMERPGQKGWAVYKDQQSNPSVPKGLGIPPAGR